MIVNATRKQAITGSALLKLESDLEGAVARGEISAVFQPQIDIRTRRVVSVEALARWNHPEYGYVGPATFIPLAEELDLITDIGDFMIDEGCRLAAELTSLGHRVDVAVNVSAAQLVTLDFLDRVEANLRRHELTTDRLIVEITESLPVIDVPEVAARLRDLRDLGLGISIDDFGTGYSSVERLAVLPATELKIDQSLIRDTAPIPAYVCEAVDTAHELGLRVVAEGIETEHHFARAVGLQCDRAQGYLFSRPTTENHLRRLLGVEL